MWTVTAAAGWFDTTIDFGPPEADLSETSAVVGASRRFGADLTVRLAAGVILGGTLEIGTREFDVGTGGLLSAAVTRRWSFGAKRRFFAAVTGALSGSFTKTTENTAGADSENLRAIDLRVGGIAGITLAKRFSPYVLLRGFGGPVLWHLDGEDLTGSDKNKYQVGAGMSLALPGNIAVVVDGSALGERSLSVGAALAF